MTLHIENEDPHTAKLEFLSRDQARRALADQVPANQLNLLDFWTDPDPVGRRDIATLLHQTAQGLSSGRQNPAQRPTWRLPKLRFKVSLRGVEQQGHDDAWTRSLTSNVLSTLANLIAHHGIISCLINVQKDERTVGHVWLTLDGTIRGTT